MARQNVTKLVGQRTRAENPTTRLVLAMLAAHASRHNLTAWPSQKTLAALCGVSDRTVRTSLRELEALGEIKVVTHGRGRAGTKYFMTLLSPDFDVIEEDENRKSASDLIGSEVPL